MSDMNKTKQTNWKHSPERDLSSPPITLFSAQTQCAWNKILNTLTDKHFSKRWHHLRNHLLLALGEMIWLCIDVVTIWWNMLDIAVGVMHNNWIDWTMELLLAFDAGQILGTAVGRTHGSSLEPSSHFAARSATGYSLGFLLRTLVGTAHAGHC